MALSLKSLALAAAGVSLASSSFAQERQLSLIQSETTRGEVLEQQDRKHRRIEARNMRAQKSICENGCRDSGLGRRTQPADPFEQLPSWDDPPVVETQSSDE
ncbi:MULTISPECIES: hypothetical protein [Microvirga]|uniref:hypothetical protein n=1 Tax=Microvirga TaxID=186650 RepID=UPI001CFF6B3E|nr:hypothetical protein [Microvirga lenta]MCB5176483.1 hypothetical protein [Microvirga lenta]